MISALVGGAHVSFYRQYAAAGMNKEIPIASTTFGVGNEQTLISAEEGDGIIAAYSYFEGADNPTNTEFLSRLEARLGAGRPVMNELAVRSYEGAMLWAEAVKLAGTPDRDPVIEALRSGLTYNGPSGAVTIDRADQPLRHERLHRRVEGPEVEHRRNPTRPSLLRIRSWSVT